MCGLFIVHQVDDILIPNIVAVPSMAPFIYIETECKCLLFSIKGFN